MNRKKTWKTRTFRLLAVTVFFGILFTMVSEPLSAKGRSWDIAVVIQTESGIVEQNDRLIMTFYMVDVEGEPTDLVWLYINIYKGDTPGSIRNRIFEAVKGNKVLDVTGEASQKRYIVVDDDYRKSTYLTIDDIDSWTKVELQNKAKQVVIKSWDP